MTTIKPEVISGRVIISTLGGPEKSVPQLMTFVQTGLVNHISNKVITNGTLGRIGGAKKSHVTTKKTKKTKKTQKMAKKKFVEVGNEKLEIENNDGGEIEAPTSFVAVERIVQRGIINALNTLEKNNGSFKNFSNKKYSMLIEVAELDKHRHKVNTIPYHVDIMMSPVKGYVGYQIRQI